MYTLISPISVSKKQCQRTQNVCMNERTKANEQPAEKNAKNVTELKLSNEFNAHTGRTYGRQRPNG